MAARKPLVINAGQIQQLQSGDVLDGVDSDLITLQNDNANAIVICAPVYSVSAGSVDLAQADAMATSEVVGLMADATTANGASGSVQTDGVLTATTGQWDSVTSESGGLVANTIYWLDPDTAGLLTITPTSTDTETVVRVGKGLSTTQMEISIQPPILL